LEHSKPEGRKIILFPPNSNLGHSSLRSSQKSSYTSTGRIDPIDASQNSIQRIDSIRAKPSLKPQDVWGSQCYADKLEDEEQETVIGRIKTPQGEINLNQKKPAESQIRITSGGLGAKVSPLPANRDGGSGGSGSSEKDPATDSPPATTIIPSIPAAADGDAAP
jgi:hypothetical protein